MNVTSIVSNDETARNTLVCKRTQVSYCLLIIGLSLLIRCFFIGFNDLLVEEAYYWNYSLHLDFGYLDHPPMVAFLIKLSTLLLGDNEVSVRLPTLICWFFTAFFSFKLTNLMRRGAGLYAVMLLSILPFFFIQSLVITPDAPLLVCWSAILYYLYRVLVQGFVRDWYWVGLWLGLGMLSKYTIVLLGLPTLVFLCAIPDGRYWFKRKEPYLCIFIGFLLFTPVLYWNISHHWASFVFQSVRRVNESFSFSFHQVIGLLLAFLMPIGLISMWALFKKNINEQLAINYKQQRFLQYFTALPLIFFAVFSLTHQVKFNWIGPCLLALIPWIALLMSSPATSSILQKNKFTTRMYSLCFTNWFLGGVLISCIYFSLIFIATLGTPGGGVQIAVYQIYCLE